jgi:hypothetical protein|eukprot:COSAG06_NODE_5105_length_3716_cov_2.563450_6_plen_50_part_00
MRALAMGPMMTAMPFSLRSTAESVKLCATAAVRQWRRRSNESRLCYVCC